MASVALSGCASRWPSNGCARTGAVPARARTTAALHDAGTAADSSRVRRGRRAGIMRDLQNLTSGPSSESRRPGNTGHATVPPRSIPAETTSVPCYEGSLNARYSPG